MGLCNSQQRGSKNNDGELTNCVPLEQTELLQPQLEPVCIDGCQPPVVGVVGDPCLAIADNGCGDYGSYDDHFDYNNDCEEFYDDSGYCETPMSMPMDYSGGCGEDFGHDGFCYGQEPFLCPPPPRARFQPVPPPQACLPPPVCAPQPPPPPPISCFDPCGRFNSANTRMCDLSSREVKRLRKLFSKYSGFDRKLSFQEFTSIMRNNSCELACISPCTLDLCQLKRCFEASDLNCDGLINFDQFLYSYALCKPTHSTTEPPPCFPGPCGPPMPVPYYQPPGPGYYNESYPGYEHTPCQPPPMPHPIRRPPPPPPPPYYEPYIEDMCCNNNNISDGNICNVLYEPPEGNYFKPPPLPQTQLLSNQQNQNNYDCYEQYDNNNNNNKNHSDNYDYDYDYNDCKRNTRIGTNTACGGGGAGFELPPLPAEAERLLSRTPKHYKHRVVIEPEPKVMMQQQVVSSSRRRSSRGSDTIRYH